MVARQANVAPSSAALVGEIAAEFFDRVARGERPDVEQYAQRYPEIADVIREMFPALDLLGPPTDGASSGGEHHIDPQELNRLGDYEIVGELGRGGMGVVYEAHQISLNRRVALKVLPFAAVMDPKQLTRFKNEAQAAASLDHPNIVDVYAVGCERSVHYYAMRYILGQSVAELIADLRQLTGLDQHDAEGDDLAGVSQLARNLSQGPVGHSNGDAAREGDQTVNNGLAALPALSPSAETRRDVQAAISTQHSLENRGQFYRNIARLAIQAASALDHAHTQGILHRDVKPGNLMVDEEGNLWVTDFGLARIESEAGMTMTGDILGTLRYMSPEQALAKRVIVDHRADIYSLGVTLYELLGLRPAYTAADRQVLLKQIAFEDAPRLRQLDRTIPVELETIVGKAIEKNPESRYQTAQELAEDLQRFLDDEPIRAKRPTLADQVTKWSRRHVGWVWTTVAASMVISVVLASATLFVARSRQAAVADRQRAERERQYAVEQQNLARQHQYYAEMVAGQSDAVSKNLSGLYGQLVDYLPLPAEEDLRDWEWYYLMSRCRPEVRTLVLPHFRVGRPFAAFSPDGKYIGSPTAIWEADTGERIRRIDPSLIRRMGVAWSPDGSKFAWTVVHDDNAIYIWDRTTDKVTRLAGHTDSAWSLVWSADGSQIASGSGDDTIRVWDVASVTELWRIATPGNVMSLDWSSDGQFFAAGIHYYGVQVWDVSSRQLVTERRAPGNHHMVSWHPSGESLAVCEEDRWYLLSREDWTIAQEQTIARGRAVAYSPDGSKIAVAHGESVSIWDESGTDQVAQIDGHVNPLASVSWHPDGQQLVTGDETDEIKVWNLDRREQQSAIQIEGEIADLHWAMDERPILFVNRKDGSEIRWDVRSGTRDRREQVTKDTRSRMSPARPLAAVVNEENHVLEIRDTSNEEVYSVIPLDARREFYSCTLSPNGSHAAIQAADEGYLVIEVWDVNKEQFLWRWENLGWESVSGELQTGPLRLLQWSSNGQHIAGIGPGDAGETGGTYWKDHLHVFDVADGKRTFKHLPNVPREETTLISWSADDRFVALGALDGHLEIVDALEGRRVCSEKIHRDGITAIAWHPAGRRVACGTRDGMVKLTTVDEGIVLLSLPLPNAGGVRQLAWSRNGHRLAAATADGRIHIWDAANGYEISAEGPRRGELAWAYRDLAERAVDEQQRRAALGEFVRLAPDNLGFWEERGDAYAEVGDYQSAVDEFSKGIESNIAQAFYAAGSRTYALLAAGRRDEHAELCARLQKEFAKCPVLSNRGSIAWLCALTPNEQLDADNVLNMAQSCFQNYSTDMYRLIHGACLYRAEKREDAVRVLNELVDMLNRGGDWKDDYYLACAKYFLAMARHDMGHSFQARRLLSEANAAADKLAQHATWRDWTTRIDVQVLREEATSIIAQ